MKWLVVVLGLAACEPVADPFPNGPRVFGDRVIVGDEHSAGLAILRVARDHVVDIDRIGLAATPLIVKVPDNPAATPRAVALTDRSIERVDLETGDVERADLGSSLRSLAISDDGDVAIAAGSNRVVLTRFTKSTVNSVFVGGSSTFSAEAFFPGSHTAVVTATERMFLVDGDSGTSLAIELGSDPTPDRALALADGPLRRVVGLATSAFGTPAFVTLDPDSEASPIVYVVRGTLDHMFRAGTHAVAWGEGERVFTMPLDGSEEPTSYGFAREILGAVAIDDSHVGLATEDVIVRLDLETGVQDELVAQGKVLSLHAADGRMVAAVEVGRSAELLVFVAGQQPRIVSVPGPTSAAVVMPAAASLAAIRLVEGGRAVLWDEDALDDEPLVVPGFFLHGYLEREDP